jgi:anti-sigma factor RsiW
MDHRPASCARTSELVSLALDHELSPFLQAMLERHLARCEACSMVARTMAGMTEALRATPAEEFRLETTQFRSRRRVGRVARSAVATAGVATVGIWLGVSLSSGPGTARPSGAPRLVRPVAIVDDRTDWPAGIPSVQQKIRLIPGGLQTAGKGP